MKGISPLIHIPLRKKKVSVLVRCPIAGVKLHAKKPVLWNKLSIREVFLNIACKTAVGERKFPGIHIREGSTVVSHA